MSIFEKIVNMEKTEKEHKPEVKPVKIGYFFTKTGFELIVFVEINGNILHYSCNTPKFPELVRNDGGSLTLEDLKFGQEAVKQFLAKNKHKIGQKALLLYRHTNEYNNLNLFLLDILDL